MNQFDKNLQTLGRVVATPDAATKRAALLGIAYGITQANVTDFNHYDTEAVTRHIGTFVNELNEYIMVDRTTLNKLCNDFYMQVYAKPEIKSYQSVSSYDSAIGVHKYISEADEECIDNNINLFNDAGRATAPMFKQFITDRLD